MAVTTEIKNGWGSLKTHWLFFAVLILLLVLLAIGYDKKSGTFSAWRAKIATWPLIGPLFTAFALVLGGAHVLYAAGRIVRLIGGVG